MAVDIESFKRDLDELKNQRSVIQAKLDEANRHLSELTETLKGMGFNSVADAKQAYVKQMSEAESQHDLVKKLIQEIRNVDMSVPTRDEVLSRLKSLDSANVQAVQPAAAAVEINQPNLVSTNEVPVMNVNYSENDFIQQNVVPPAVENKAPVQDAGVQADLSDMLFASL